MAINEKPSKLEFCWEKGANKIQLEYENDKITIISPPAQGNDTFSIDFFVEIVDFLKKKGIISAKILTETSQTVPFGSDSTLSVPVIEGEEKKSTEESVDLSKSDSVKPLMNLSFGESGKTPPKLAEDESGKTPPKLVEDESGKTPPKLVEDESGKTPPKLVEDESIKKRRTIKSGEERDRLKKPEKVIKRKEEE